MDYLTLRKHCKELSQALEDKPLVARIFAIPGRGFCWRLKNKNGFSDLVFQLEPAIQGCWLTQKACEVEQNFPLLRQMQRLLVNGRIISVALAGSEGQMQFDRVLKLQIAVADSFFGNRSDYFLICEFTGRIANIFLADQELKIIEGFTRTPNNSNGQIYQLPESNCKINPFVASLKELEDAFSAPHQTWCESIGAFSPPLAKELAWRTREHKTTAALAAELKNIIEESCANKESFLVIDAQKVLLVSAYRPLRSFPGEKLDFPSVSQTLRFAEEKVTGLRRFEQAKAQILKHFQKDLSGRLQILEKQRKLETEFTRADDLAKMGNLIVANLYQIPAGARCVELDDWETGQKINVELDPAKPASVQAQKYFQRYRKAQRGQVEVSRRIVELESEIRWLKEQIWLVDSATTQADLPEKEKSDQKGGKKQAERAGGRKKKPHFPPLLEIDSCRYYVGKNGKQNDIVTFQIASRKDRWFHANDVPGAHVILKKLEGEVTELDLRRGALLAAWFSFARESSKVAVDTTEAVWVKKIPGGGPGRVSYTNQNTLYVNPQEAREFLSLISNGD